MLLNDPIRYCRRKMIINQNTINERDNLTMQMSQRRIDLLTISKTIFVIEDHHDGNEFAGENIVQSLGNA